MQLAPRLPALLLFSVFALSLSALPGTLLRSADEEAIVLRDYLVLPPVRRARRAPIPFDPVRDLLARGRWSRPSEGETLDWGGQVRAWSRVQADEKGALSHRALRGGYAFTVVTVPERRVVLLDGQGHSMVYVRGEPRIGDVYRTGWVRIPLVLEKGDNELLFYCARGRLSARLLPTPSGEVVFDTKDSTLPDLVVGEAVDTLGATVLINASDRPLRDASLLVDGPGLVPRSTPVPTIHAWSLRKVGFRVVGAEPRIAGMVELTLRLRRRKSNDKPREWQQLAETTLSLAIREAHETRKRTFRSEIDGSVQYYAVNPASRPGSDDASPALFLSLHGAAVEALGQARAYSPKSWGHVVAPTNRRPYGFDWEDWGRLDTLEVLGLAQARLKTDPSRTYLTGHSMGGHGAWHLGVTFPDRFAAIGPSAGWISFWSYAGAPRFDDSSAMEQIFRRARQPSDTLALKQNYAHHGVYIIHGEKDDNVPAAQAHRMVKELETFHHDFVYHEQPGVRHWWDASDEPGASCVDWTPLFDFFARRRRPEKESVRQVDFVTANPGISPTCDWLTIETQLAQLKPSSVSLRLDPLRRRYSGTTENVHSMVLDLAPLASGETIQLHIDEQTLEDVPYPESQRLRLLRDGESWTVAAGALSPQHKGPHRYGLFKDAFRHRVVLVYGTLGTPEENAWALAKARFDAETFWYRGNGSVDIVPDISFRAEEEPDRNVVLYGNASFNAAWLKLLPDSPVSVARRKLVVGDRLFLGDAYGCLLIRPRPGSERASVGAVCGTGLPGLRLTDRLPYFVSGVAYPDLTILGPEATRKGIGGVIGAGFFGLDWSVEGGEFVWQDESD